METLAKKEPSGGPLKRRHMRACDKDKAYANTLIRLVVKHEAGRLAASSEGNLQLLLDAVLYSRSGTQYAMVLVADLTQHEQCRQAMQQHIRGRLAAEVSRLRRCSSESAAQWADKCEQLLHAIDGAGGEQQPQPPLVAAVPAGAAVQSLPQQQQQEQQQPQEQHQRMVTAAVQQCTGAVVPPNHQQQHKAAPGAGKSAAAAAGLGPAALVVVKCELGAIPNQQQQEYWSQADKPFNQEELQQLAQHYLLPRPSLTNRDFRGDFRGNNASRVPVQAGTSIVQRHYGALAPRLTELYREVLVARGESSAVAVVPKRKTAAAGSEALQFPGLTAAQTLLWALRCLRLWEAKQVTQPEMPQVLRQLFAERHGSAAVADADAEVQEFINLARIDDDDDQRAGGTSQQQHKDSILVRTVKGAQGGRSAKRVKVEPASDSE